MIMSMTGFGKAQLDSDDVQISIEVKSVNSRFLETSVRLPRQLSSFEPDIKEYLKKNIERGKISINVNFNAGKSFVSTLKLDSNLLKQYMGIIEEIKHFPGVNKEYNVSDILNLPDVVNYSFSEEKETAFRELMLDALKRAVENFNEARKVEGNALVADINGRLNLLKEYLAQINDMSKDVVKENIEKLKNRISEISEFDKFDKDRLETEVVMQADRLDITEEIIRLNTHIDACDEAIHNGAHPGKKLNFLAQEMHREANTIGSKSGNVKISHLSVSLKEEIEKIREQVQNIE